MRISAGLDLPHLPGGHPLRPILGAALRRKGLSGARASGAGKAHWDAAHFGLDKTRAYRELSERGRRQVLEACGRSLLEEGYFIEKLGLAFTAKMTALSRTTEERQLYCLFAADEAAHLAVIGSFLPGVPSPQGNPFLRLIARVIEEGAKPGLTYLIQVVLEGWGVSHYRDLAAGCRDPELARALAGIVRDEALHHGSGAALLEGAPVPESERAFVTEILASLISMVRAGPQEAAGHLERAAGGLTLAARARVFSELDCRGHSARRIKRLQTLMAAAESGPILETLQSKGVLTPLDASACAKIRTPPR